MDIIQNWLYLQQLLPMIGYYLSCPAPLSSYWKLLNLVVCYLFFSMSAEPMRSKKYFANLHRSLRHTEKGVAQSISKEPDRYDLCLATLLESAVFELWTSWQSIQTNDSRTVTIHTFCSHTCCTTTVKRTNLAILSAINEYRLNIGCSFTFISSGNLKQI